MQQAWECREVGNKFELENLKERDYLGKLGVDKRVI
jgi:hypothetical protein